MCLLFLSSHTHMEITAEYLQCKKIMSECFKDKSLNKPLSCLRIKYAWNNVYLLSFSEEKKTLVN